MVKDLDRRFKLCRVLEIGLHANVTPGNFSLKLPNNQLVTVMFARIATIAITTVNATLTTTCHGIPALMLPEVASVL